MFQLSDREVNKLLEYFIWRAGYISYETDMAIHELIKRLQKYEKENSKQEIHSEKIKE